MEFDEVLDNSAKREVVKATGVAAATVSGSPLALVLAAALGVAVEMIGQLGEKRTKELFDTQELQSRVISEIKASDDFASFVYDIWLKHNFESSENRRKRLKSVLKVATYKKKKDFENFTRIIVAAQQIDDIQIQALDLLYKDLSNLDPTAPVYLKSDNGLDGRPVSGWKVNAAKFGELLEARGVDFDSEELTSILNQLCYLGLLSTYVAMDGEYYSPTNLGGIFLEYVEH
jgi:hypothetical protein